MKLNELKPALGSTTAPAPSGPRRRLRPGQDVRQGPQGAKARSGGGKRPGFEGGPDASGSPAAEARL